MICYPSLPGLHNMVVQDCNANQQAGQGPAEVAHVTAHNNPYIMGMNNDGTLAYDHQKDGSTQQLAGCLRDFRNKPFPVKARITYYQNTLTVYIQIYFKAIVVDILLNLTMCICLC